MNEMWIIFYKATMYSYIFGDSAGGEILTQTNKDSTYSQRKILLKKMPVVSTDKF